MCRKVASTVPWSYSGELVWDAPRRKSEMLMDTSSLRHLSIVLVIGCCSQTTLAQSSVPIVRYTAVAISGQKAPGIDPTIAFSGFSSAPQINQRGQVAFKG